jgi:CspA family cold shock protein
MKDELYDAKHREVVQQPKGASGSSSPMMAAKMSVHVSTVEAAGMHGLYEGQKVSFEVVANRKTGKSSAENLRAV